MLETAWMFTCVISSLLGRFFLLFKIIFKLLKSRTIESCLVCFFVRVVEIFFSLSEWKTFPRFKILERSSQSRSYATTDKQNSECKKKSRKVSWKVGWKVRNIMNRKVFDSQSENEFLSIFLCTWFSMICYKTSRVSINVSTTLCCVTRNSASLESLEIRHLWRFWSLAEWSYTSEQLSKVISEAKSLRKYIKAKFDDFLTLKKLFLIVYQDYSAADDQNICRLEILGYFDVKLIIFPFLTF